MSLTVDHSNRTDNGVEYETFTFKLYLERDNTSSTTQFASEVYHLYGNTTTFRVRFDWSNGQIKIFTQLKSLDGVISPYKIEIRGAAAVLTVLQTDLYNWRLTGIIIIKHFSVICAQTLTLILCSCPRLPFEELYNDTYFTDFDLFGEDNNDKAVSVHRNVLAVSSPVLKTMFLGDWKESKQGYVQSPDVSEATLQHFKDYIYLRKIPENPLDYAKLLSLASFYMIYDLSYLEEKGADMMESCLKPVNSWEWFEYCVEHKSSKLILICLKHFIRYKSVRIAELEKHFSTYFKNPAYELKEVETVNSYKDLYDDTDFTDFQLCVEGEDVTVPAHRNVLAAFSPVLKTKLLQEWKDAKQGYMPSVSIATAQQFKDYIYLKRMPEAPTDCAKLLPLATRYEMPELERDAAIKIASNFQPENAWEWFDYCMKNKADYLLVAILKNIDEENKIPALEEYFSKP